MSELPPSASTACRMLTALRASFLPSAERFADGGCQCSSLLGDAALKVWTHLHRSLDYEGDDSEKDEYIGSARHNDGNVGPCVMIYMNSEWSALFLKRGRGNSPPKGS